MIAASVRQEDEMVVCGSKLYYKGWFCQVGMLRDEPDIEGAIACYEQAIKEGYPEVALALGDLYRMEKDPENAYRWYLECALTSGEVMAYYHLAVMHHEGTFLRQNDARAFKLFRLAFDEGCDEAAYYLGRFYENGICTKPDHKKALSFYRRGAEKMDARCLDRLRELGADIHRSIAQG